MDEARTHQHRRLRQLALDVSTLDLSAPDLVSQVEALRRRATTALREGKLLRGNPSSLEQARAIALERRSADAASRRAAYLPEIQKLRKAGFTSLKEIATELDRRGVKPPKADKWRPQTIRLIEDAPAHPA